MNLTDLRIKLYADGADLTEIRQLANLPYIKGFTTNPTLMRKAGVDDYEQFARRVLDAVTDKPVSFEVLSDDFDEMERQAKKIASWGENVYVKIPITNTAGLSAVNTIGRLSHDDVKVNVTAIMTSEQARLALLALCDGAPGIVSIFAGRIADAGCNPVEIIRGAIRQRVQMRVHGVEVLWASTREVYNIMQADHANCDIITVPEKILVKLNGLGGDLNHQSLAMVKQFYNDAVAAGYTL